MKDGLYLKKIILYTIIILSINCMGQNKTLILNLQQIEFKDKILTKTLFDISKSESDCFKKYGFYILDFFQSSLSSREYYLSIREFMIDAKTPNSVAYYIVINNKFFFVSDKVSPVLFSILPSKRNFVIKEEVPHIGGDYNFLIHRTLSGYYQILLKSCAE